MIKAKGWSNSWGTVGHAYIYIDLFFLFKQRKFKSIESSKLHLSSVIKPTFFKFTRAESRY